ncbi:MAG: flagellar basal body L-ring protein FlgH [Leptothrix sp. (in: b-proteobacteria)]
MSRTLRARDGRRLRTMALTLAASALLAACGSMAPSVPKVDVAEPTSARPLPLPAPVLNSGAIFQAAAYRPLFEDHRARLVGDTLTVQIIEKVSATATSTSTVEKTGSVDASITAVPILPAGILAKLAAGGSSSNKFAGKGDTVNSNEFTGTITCTVIEVLPNGHLLISGEKQVGVNDNADVLRFSGQVDPRAIQVGNSVASAQIANVRVEQRGRGGGADAQKIGWLSRFFLNLLPI